MSYFPPVYLTINERTNAARRLESLRAKAANESAPDWRKVRAWTFANGAAAYGVLSASLIQSDNGPLAPKRAIWYTHTGPQFRNERFADEVDGAYIKHTGWFSDAHQNRTVRGLVADLSHGRFIAGYYSSDNGERVYLDRIYDDVKEAARDADREAERMAEAEREYDERWQAARELSDDCEELENDIRELIPMRHHDRARCELEEAIEELRTKRDELKNDYSDIEL